LGVFKVGTYSPGFFLPFHVALLHILSALGVTISVKPPKICAPVSSHDIITALLSAAFGSCRAYVSRLPCS
jgi:hypothetical protein